jgi:hypothetical protein
MRLSQSVVLWQAGLGVRDDMYGKQYQSAKSRSKRLRNSLSNGYPDYLHCTPLLFYAATTLLLSMHRHFNNSTYMYILPQLPWLTGAPTHWLYRYPVFIASLIRAQGETQMQTEEADVLLSSLYTSMMLLLLLVILWYTSTQTTPFCILLAPLWTLC